MAYNYENLNLEKGMYRESGKTFTQVLEELDPSEKYRNTPIEGLDAYQRQLKRFDIRVKGANSDNVEKFFTTGQSSVLFPEYVARSVRTGMEEGNILPSITATVTKFDGMDYRAVYSNATEDDKSLKSVAEGASIPETEIKVSDNLVRLRKRGRLLVASYEAIRFQKLDMFSVMLRQIGGQIMKMHLDDAIEVITDGDGNENAADVYSIGTELDGTAGTLTYSALLEFWSKFDPFNLNTLLVAPDVMLDMLSLTEFQNPLTGLNFQGTGELTNPLGAKLIKTGAVPTGTVIGMDRNYALEMIQASDVMVEYDRQLERAAITSISGFAKLFKDAAKIMKV